MRKNLYKGILGFMMVLSVAVVATAAAQEESSTGPDMGESRYVDYSEAAFNAAEDQTRVYFFHAGWCPSCRALNRDINANVDRIPEDVVLFKIDYDSSTQLKTRYGVTYQHTLVVVDAEGKLVHKWTGGTFEDLLEELEEAS